MNKAKDAAEIRPTQSAPIDDTLTQAQRDMPYRQRLSASLQADDKARYKRIAESQRRHAEDKAKAASQR
ncbi:MAG: hypothetical protein M3347_07485 [Armatimonadota bacterium]|nr:hypothetical protein [Armatimonadota bacterium]